MQIESKQNIRWKLVTGAIMGLLLVVLACTTDLWFEPLANLAISLSLNTKTHSDVADGIGVTMVVIFFAVFALIFGSPLFIWWLKSRDRKRVRKHLNLAVVAATSMSLIMIGVQPACAQSQPPSDGKGKNLTLLEAAVGVAVLGLVAIGGCCVYVKAKNKAKQIEEKRKKQMEQFDDEEGTNKLASLTYQFTRMGGQVAQFDSSQQGQKAAWFPLGVVPATPEDYMDCDGLPSFYLTCLASRANSQRPVLLPYIPKKTVSVDSFLDYHGLTNFMQDCYSESRVPSGPSDITFDRDAGKIRWDMGLPSVTVTFERTTDFEHWEVLTPIEVPEGMIMIFGDAEWSRCRSVAFYRVSVN